jgi:decaprenylphospho-beta-D-erythro-pentofuranosid-2-ulose 2-reductase
MTAPDQTLLVLGGTSDIGRATARAFAANGWTIQLAGRDLEALKREADDIAARTGMKVTTHHLDVLDTVSFVPFIDALPEPPGTIVSVIGLLGEQMIAETDTGHATVIMRTNFEAPALMLGLFAERLADAGAGTIVGVSSVAGERGRASNYTALPKPVSRPFSPGSAHASQNAASTSSR